MRRRGKRELAALLAVALLAGSAACGADAGEKDVATGTAEAAAPENVSPPAMPLRVFASLRSTLHFGSSNLRKHGFFLSSPLF